MDGRIEEKSGNCEYKNPWYFIIFLKLMAKIYVTFLCLFFSVKKVNTEEVTAKPFIYIYMCSPINN